MKPRAGLGSAGRKSKKEHWTGSQRAGVPAGVGALLTEAALPDLLLRVSAGQRGGLVEEEEKNGNFERAA